MKDSRKIIAEIRLAPGQVGYYDELSRIHLTLAEPQRPVYAGTNCTRLRRSVKNGCLQLVSGTFGPEPSPFKLVKKNNTFYVVSKSKKEFNKEINKVSEKEMASVIPEAKVAEVIPEAKAIEEITPEKVTIKEEVKEDNTQIEETTVDVETKEEVTSETVETTENEEDATKTSKKRRGKKSKTAEADK